jgi:hypothetical protein
MPGGFQLPALLIDPRDRHRDVIHPITPRFGHFPARFRSELDRAVITAHENILNATTRM